MFHLLSKSPQNPFATENGFSEKMRGYATEIVHFGAQRLFSRLKF